MNDLKKIFERQDDPKKQEFLKGVFARGTLITDDPTADLMAYVAKKEEREKAEQAASGESELSDESNADPAPSELSMIDKDSLQKAINLVWKIVGGK